MKGFWEQRAWRKVQAKGNSDCVRANVQWEEMRGAQGRLGGEGKAGHFGSPSTTESCSGHLPFVCEPSGGGDRHNCHLLGEGVNETLNKTSTTVQEGVWVMVRSSSPKLDHQILQGGGDPCDLPVSSDVRLGFVEKEVFWVAEERGDFVQAPLI